MSANNKQIGGTHYQSEYQHWDYVANVLGGRYFEGQITKYLSRHQSKDGLKDVLKSLHYLDKLLELHKAGAVKSPEGIHGVDHRALARTFCDRNNIVTESPVFIGLAVWRTGRDLKELREVVVSIRDSYSSTLPDSIPDPLDRVVVAEQERTEEEPWSGEEPVRSYIDPDYNVND